MLLCLLSTNSTSNCSSRWRSDERKASSSSSIVSRIPGSMPPIATMAFFKYDMLFFSTKVSEVGSRLRASLNEVRYAFIRVLTLFPMDFCSYHTIV